MRRLRRRTAEGGCSHIHLVAAGVGLGGNQDKARTGWGWLRLCRMAERAQDAENCDVGGEDAEADGGDHGEAENEGHQERNHGS
jgi:hypothetical protein